MTRRIISRDDVEATAARWLAERDVGFTAEQAAAFERWRKADAAHEAAVVTLEETRELLAHLPLLRGEPALRQRMERVRQQDAKRGRLFRFPRILKVAVALAACVAVAVGIWRFSSLADDLETATYATAPGEYRHIVLPDGSIMELNGGTRARVEFSPARRQVALGVGEAHFAVKKDPARPFVVQARDVGVRAVGTAFSVKLEPAAVAVLVTEGSVQVERESGNVGAHSPDAPSSLVAAGQRAVVATDGSASAPQVSTYDPTAQSAALGWRGPRLVFTETALAEAVRQFNEHNRVKLEIGDAELGERAIGGTFRADAVESFVRLLQDSGDITIERSSADRIVLRKAADARVP